MIFRLRTTLIIIFLSFCKICSDASIFQHHSILPQAPPRPTLLPLVTVLVPSPCSCASHVVYAITTTTASADANLNRLSLRGCFLTISLWVLTSSSHPQHVLLSLFITLLPYIIIHSSVTDQHTLTAKADIRPQHTLIFQKRNNADLHGGTKLGDRTGQSLAVIVLLWPFLCDSKLRGYDEHLSPWIISSKCVRTKQTQLTCSTEQTIPKQHFSWCRFGP